MIKLRWVILVMLFMATGLNFLDRQVLSMTIIKIQEEFNISDVEYGIVNTSFLLSYGLMFTIAGRLIDRIGGKAGLAISVGIWSVANTLHGLMTNFTQMLIYRFMLGAGEGGCFPGAAKTVTEWFGKKDRALANGVAIGGSAIGAVIAPPITILISSAFGWRWSFVIPGLIGIVWVVGWLFLPNRGAVESQPDKRVQAKPIPFLALLRSREVITFVVMRFLLDPVFYFIMFWVPKYLNAEKGASFERVGQLFWIPFLALGISNIMGGWFSDRLIARGMSVDRARKTVMGIAAALTISLPAVTLADNPEMAVAFIAVMMLAHGIWITNYITAISDVFGQSSTSTVVGLSGTAGALSALALNPLIGYVIQSYSYQPLWIIAGVMYPIAFLLLIVLIPQLKPAKLLA